MKQKTRKIRKKLQKQVEIIKETGVKIDRKHIYGDYMRYTKENQSALKEAQDEMKVLRMKKFFKFKGWNFPPETHKATTVVHLLNNYYGKEVCRHEPKDELEKP